MGGNLTNRRPAIVPIGRLFVGVSDPQETTFPEGAAKQLESHWEIYSIPVGESTGNAHAADARKVCCNGENIRQIHLERVIGLFSEAERCLR